MLAGEETAAGGSWGHAAAESGPAVCPGLAALPLGCGGCGTEGGREEEDKRAVAACGIVNETPGAARSHARVPLSYLPLQGLPQHLAVSAVSDRPGAVLASADLPGKAVPRAGVSVELEVLLTASPSSSRIFCL